MFFENRTVSFFGLSSSPEGGAEGVDANIDTSEESQRELYDRARDVARDSLRYRDRRSDVARISSDVLTYGQTEINDERDTRLSLLLESAENPDEIQELINNVRGNTGVNVPQSARGTNNIYAVNSAIAAFEPHYNYFVENYVDPSNPNSLRSGRLFDDVYRGRLDQGELNRLQALIDADAQVSQVLDRGRSYAVRLRGMLEGVEADRLVDEIEVEFDAVDLVADTSNSQSVNIDGIDESVWEEGEDLTDASGVVTASSLFVRDVDGNRDGSIGRGDPVDFEGNSILMSLGGEQVLMGRLKGTAADGADAERYVALGFVRRNQTNRSPRTRYVA